MTEDNIILHYRIEAAAREARTSQATFRRYARQKGLTARQRFCGWTLEEIADIRRAIEADKDAKRAARKGGRA